MSWDDDTVAEVLRLYGEGYSMRAIAREVGISRRQVENILAEYEAIEAEAEAELLDGLDDDERAALEPIDADYVPVPPFVFVGIERGDGLTTIDSWRYLDANGYSATAFDVYRATQALESANRWDEAAEIEANLDAQYEAVAEREGLYREYYGGNAFVWRRRDELLT